ncbi:YktB family protein [Salimicrobium halophilum]|uniref:UPF0637 protein SAMN04490247_0634 n=1 Tax=Salimicrobium halophilum TaxID=86666 RepID=A0A1G8QI71_9BACI|nr:DUF1054 domain-containing protein [Salimicrobium halophilum]SDJ04361.1 Uncharacterized protein YktB, UPF0637 family [Salimicrobium halophilum]
MGTFNGFDQKDFEVFHIEGLEERMEILRSRLSPKLEDIAETLAPDLAAQTGEEMFVHVAKHARRSKNPPNDTWAAIANNKRGYKKLPHFQIGLWEDKVFLWLAFIYEAPNKESIAEAFLNDFVEVTRTIPEHYVLSKDHTKNEDITYNEDNLEKVLTRFRDVKKGEFLVGRRFDADDPLLTDEQAFIQEAKQTFETLLPIYRKALAS